MSSKEIKENMEAYGKKYIVYGEGLGHTIGFANSFGECKDLHKKWLEDINHPNKEMYAGLECGSNYLKEGLAFPVFYEE